MSTRSWPSDLPDEQFEDLNYNPGSGRIRTSMDQGPAKQRKRFTAVPKFIQLDMYLDGDQLQSFETWFEDTLDHGVLDFDWEHPVDDTTVEMRFVENPKWSLEKGAEDPSNRLWKATFKLEILPS